MGAVADFSGAVLFLVVSVVFLFCEAAFVFSAPDFAEPAGFVFAFEASAEMVVPGWVEFVSDSLAPEDSVEGGEWLDAVVSFDNVDGCELLPAATDLSFSPAVTLPLSTETFDKTFLLGFHFLDDCLVPLGDKGGEVND